MSFGVGRRSDRSGGRRLRRRTIGVQITLGLAIAAPVAAQPPPVQQPPVTVRQLPDSLRPRADTMPMPGDSTRRPLVEWTPPDSILQALLARTGFAATRYQGERWRFDAERGTLVLIGSPAAVGRGESVIVGDSIIYNQSTEIVIVYGDPLTIRDPSRNASDIVSQGRVVYDLAAGRAMASQVCTAMDSDERWYTCAEPAAIVNDSLTGQRTFFGHAATFTSCDLQPLGRMPHYHFGVSDVKFIGQNLLVARNAVLYIDGIPVIWLPFMFQDMRSGRRSGLLTPRFGIAELLRNSPTYRRTVDNVGYYFAISDYMDAQISMDWRSGARPQEGDPGYTRYNGEWRYRWLSRFVSGNFGVSHLRQQDGRTNTALSLAHNQEFSQASRLNASLNYVTSTEVQRQNEFVPYRQLATIASRLNYSNRFGPFSFSAGGSRTQYPGLDQVDQTLPTLSLTTEPIEIAPWFVWSPSFVASNSENLNRRQTGTYLFGPGTGGALLDSAVVEGDRRTTTASFETPIKIFGWTFSNSFRASDVEDNFPQLRTIQDVRDTSIRSTRVFERTYRTEIDWQTRLALPAVFSGTWNLTPSVSFVNVDPAAMWVRTERTGREFVMQSKRPQFGLSVAPTFYGLFEPSFGPFSALRHAINLSMSWGYAPEATVSDEFLAAIGATRPTYLGSLRRNSVSLSFSTNVEAKRRTRADSVPARTDTVPAPGDSAAPFAPPAGGGAADAQKLNLLAINFDALTWDFERARATGGTGLTTDRFGANLRSDLLPGLDFSMAYSLFEGSTLTDTARFKPFLTDVRASFSLNRDRNPFVLLNRLFGRAVPTSPEPAVDSVTREEGGAIDERRRQEQMGSLRAGGVTGRQAYIGLPASGDWAWSLNFSMNRQRPPSGNVTVVEANDTEICTDPALGLDPFGVEQCVRERQAARLGEDPNDAQTTPGGVFIRVPATATVQSNLSAPITANWSGGWQTTYDFETQKFASHAINLERQMHDWRATFSILHAPNGNFSFSFFIALKAQPDLKFDYNRQSYRRGAR